MSNPAPFDLAASAAAYAADLLKGGATRQHAEKQRRTVMRAGLAPGAFLEAQAGRWTAATLTDLRTRLACYGGWLASQGASPVESNPWRALPRGIRAGKVAQDRAVFEADEVGRLLSCPAIAPHRRAFYRCIGTLGLRPVEASRIEAQHIVREGAGFVLRLPGASQKSGRPDPVHLESWQAEEILANLPLVRVGLNHFEETFQRDLCRAKISIKQGKATRRLYDLRSFMISHLLREGVDLLTVQKLARHKRVETTLLFYVRHNEERAGQVRAKVFSKMKARRLAAGVA